MNNISANRTFANIPRTASIAHSVVITP